MTDEENGGGGFDPFALFRELLADIWNAINNAVSYLSSLILSAISSVLTTLEWVKGVILDALEKARKSLEDYIKQVYSIIRQMILDAVKGISALIDTVKAALEALLRNIADRVLSAVQVAWEAITRVVSDGVARLWDLINGVRDAVLSAIKTGVDGLSSQVQGVASGVGALVDLFTHPEKFADYLLLTLDAMVRP
jgi:phage-related protein